MWHKTFKQISRHFLIAILLLPILLPVDSNAQMYEGVRSMKWETGRCKGGGYNSTTGQHTADVLNFNPFANNQDLHWDPSNPVCGTLIAVAATSLIGIKTMCGYQCANFTEGPIYSASVAAGVPLSPQMVKDQAKDVAYCSTQAYACSTGVGAATSCPAAFGCCGSLVAVAAVTAGLVGSLGVIYGVANGAYQKARICGTSIGTHNVHNGKPWSSWSLQPNPNSPSVTSDVSTVASTSTDSADPKNPAQIYMFGTYSGSYRQDLVDRYSGTISPNPALSMKNPMKDRGYREYLFGGVEYEDNSDNPCELPKWSGDLKNTILGYDSGKMRYYMTGPNSTPVFACYRFLMANGTDEDTKEGLKAYQCCNKKSQSLICIENAANVAGPEGEAYEYKFCDVGSKCQVKGVTFETYISQTKSNYACARTYSVCPYNHPLGGGTEIEDDNDYTNKGRCQYMKHCSILPIQPYVRTSGLTGAFFDQSCRDMKGSSQNNYGYNSQLLPVDVRNFSAPIAECFKETIQNMFFNRAGSTACSDPAESPDSNGKCKNGYKYKKGESLSSYQKSLGQSGESFFVSIQSKLQGVIKMVLSMAIMFFGMSILIGGSEISKSQIMSLVVKFGFVMYFATGNEWQDWVLNGIIGTSTQLSDMMFRTDTLTGTVTTSNDLLDNTAIYNTATTVDSSKLDGCQFPRYNYNDSSPVTKYNNPAYPPGKEYLRVWDTLDCKIMRALGYGVEVSVPNLVMMILAGFITGGVGLVFVVATFVFAFFLIALTIRALHIFILSTVSIIIMFYVSPIIISCVMFQKTKTIFDAWLKNLIGFVLQPMVLFAYLGIMLNLFDTVLMGDVTFIGDGHGAPKSVVCSGEAVNKSIYCIFNPPVSGNKGVIGTYNALEKLGIYLPVLIGMNSAKIATLIQAALIFFILMSFMDKISGFASTLVGGSTLESNTMSASQMASKAYGAGDAIRKRGMGMLKKNIAPAAMKKAGQARSGLAAVSRMMGGGKKASNAGADRSEASSGQMPTASDSASNSGASAPTDNDKKA